MPRRSYRRLGLTFPRSDLARSLRSGLTLVQGQEHAPDKQLTRLDGGLANHRVDRTGGVHETRRARGLEVSHHPGIAPSLDRGMPWLDRRVDETDLRVGIAPHQELCARLDGQHA